VQHGVRPRDLPDSRSIREVRRCADNRFDGYEGGPKGPPFFCPDRVPQNRLSRIEFCEIEEEEGDFEAPALQGVASRKGKNQT